MAAAANAPRSITLPLGCLTLEHVVRYIDARFGPECLSELAPAVHYATGGNPFMMVNAIDSLVSAPAGRRGARRMAAGGFARGDRCARCRGRSAK